MPSNTGVFLPAAQASCTVVPRWILHKTLSTSCSIWEGLQLRYNMLQKRRDVARLGKIVFGDRIDTSSTQPHIVSKEPMAASAHAFSRPLGGRRSSEHLVVAGEWLEFTARALYQGLRRRNKAEKVSVGQCRGPVSALQGPMVAFICQMQSTER
jgi:hypothetical protein